MSGQKLFIAQPEIGQKLYGALATAQVWEGELEQKARGVVTLEDLSAPEYWFLRGGRLLAAGRTIAGVAGQFATLQLVPDQAQGTLYVVERVVIVNNTATIQEFNVGFGIASVGLPIMQPVARDDGNPAVVFPGSISAAEIRFGNIAVAPQVGNAFAVSLAANAGQVTIEGPWVIRRNTPFIIRSALVAAAGQFNIVWRERALLDTERARF